MDRGERRSVFLIYMTAFEITGLLFSSCMARPQFDRKPEYVQAAENKSTPIGTFIFTLRATNNASYSNEITIFTSDPVTKLYVNISQGDKRTPTTANITLIKELDRELFEGRLELKFSLVDTYGKNDSKSVYLYVLDVCDESPQFERPSYTLEIDEINITEPILVFREIRATDKDNGVNAVVTYRMEPKTNSSYLSELYNDTFRIDPINGSIYLLRSLDYENNSLYQFTLYSQDTCNLTAHPVDLLVKVKDVQDTPPFFVGLPYWISIPEGSYTHAFVLRVTAIDGDRDVPNLISYIYIQGDRFCQEHFVLNSTMGEIVTNGILDWESDEMKRIHGVCSFIVQATEIDNHPENQRGQTVANATVTVIILQLQTQTPHIPINRTTTYIVHTASTSIAPASQRPPSYVPNPGEYELHLEFDMKVEMAYNATYADKTSSQFQNLAKIFSISLTEVYKNITGFKSIDILRFRPGSVYADYLVNVFGTADVAMVTDEISSNVVRSLTSINGVPVNTAYTSESMIRRLDNMKMSDKCSLASRYLCPFGYYCKPAIASTSIILCIDRCNSSVCQNNGECYIGHHSDDAQCRCGFSENVVYSGQRCEIKTGVVTVQDRNLYLIIACAIVGGILVVFISTVFVINRKRNRLKKRLTINHVLQLDEMHKQSKNGVTAMDDRYVMSHNPASRIYPEGYSGGTVNVSYQDQELDGGYLQVRHCDRRSSDQDYDYIGPELEVGSRPQHY